MGKIEQHKHAKSYKKCLYHGCCMLTNQIAQLEVGNFHKHLLRGGYYLPKAMLIIMFYSFLAMVQA